MQPTRRCPPFCLRWSDSPIRRVLEMPSISGQHARSAIVTLVGLRRQSATPWLEFFDFRSAVADIHQGRIQEPEHRILFTQLKLLRWPVKHTRLIAVIQEHERVHRSLLSRVSVVLIRAISHIKEDLRASLGILSIGKNMLGVIFQGRVGEA